MNFKPIYFLSVFAAAVGIFMVALLSAYRDLADTLIPFLYPSSSTILSISRQIVYLLDVERGTNSDRSRLKDIIIGVQTVREIEAIDLETAEIFHKIAGEAKKM